MTSLTDLAQLAEEATPGPWVDRDGDVLTDDPPEVRFVVCEHATSDAPFIAACSPEVVLALIRVAQAAQTMEWAHTTEHVADAVKEDAGRHLRVVLSDLEKVTG